MDAAITASVPHLYHGAGRQVVEMMTITTQRKRARTMAVILAEVAVTFYLVFIFATANGL